MTETKTDAERVEFLASLGLSPEAPALVVAETRTAPAKPYTAPAAGVVLAPDGVDPHTMPVTDIVFDARLLDGFPTLTGDGIKAASDYVFSLYKSKGRNKDRHSLLHSRITKFIGQVRQNRDTGGYVKDQVKATKEERDLAAIIAATGITAADLAAMLTALKGKE
jgi:hypothetical protein